MRTTGTCPLRPHRGGVPFFWPWSWLYVSPARHRFHRHSSFSNRLLNCCVAAVCNPSGADSYAEGNHAHARPRLVFKSALRLIMQSLSNIGSLHWLIFFCSSFFDMNDNVFTHDVMWRCAHIVKQSLKECLCDCQRQRRGVGFFFLIHESCTSILRHAVSWEIISLITLVVW